MVATVTLGSRALAAAGHGDMVWGHLAVRDPEGRGVWMKAPGWGLEEIRPDRVVLVGWDGRSLAGPATVHKEYPIHTEIMRARPDVNVTVHTHAAAVNAFSALGVPLLPISHDAVIFAEYGLPRYTATANLVSTSELGRALAEDLGRARACLMPQHGLVAAGEDVAHAVMTAILLQRACEVQVTALATGEIRHWTGHEESLEKASVCWPDSQMQAGWRYWMRQVDNTAIA
ncbi:class II aldolase/adducin family protein [Microtetraspora fusca]|uniref:class II aldolase/adducin family protein n=1 Tax=Microtetraspora fusca TaxID=1997 RepID=UPI001FE1EB17|nr:class II aldolase/adducin family protein [Microtetraspora fusca]